MSKKLIHLFSFVLVLGLVLPSVAHAVHPKPVAWWKLNGDALDSSDNERNGTLHGNPQWVPGVYGDALQFDGDDYVTIDGYKGIVTDGTNTSAFTITAWFKAISNGEIVGWGSSGDGNRAEFRVNGDRLRYESGGGNVQADTNVTDNRWHHGAVTIPRNAQYVDVTIYLDGKDDTQPENDTDVVHPLSGNDVIMGQRYSQNNSRWYTGAIDDLRIYDVVLTLEEIQEAMAGIGPVSLLASEPGPEDESTDVPRDVVLSWTTGTGAISHDVYFGTDEAALAIANESSPEFKIKQGTTTYTPETLALDATYYWRIDEYDGTTTHTGEVWQFTVELFAYAIPGEKIIATASSSVLTKGPENTVNGLGLDDSGLLHGNVGDNNMWLSGATGPQPTWIQYEFDKVHKLHEMWVWNSNESLETVVGFGFKDVSIEYSVNGTDYTTLGTTHEFARAPGAPDYAYNTTVDFGGVAVKYVRLTANSNWGGILNQYGLSEVRFLRIPVHARKPDPDSGTTDVSIGTIDEPIDVTLGWNAGREAAQHDVYFSDSKQAVIDGTAPVTTVTESSYGPLSLDLGGTYYWRVDEVNEAETPATWQGELWDFTTQEYFVLEDFESYNDLDPADPNSNRIFLTWLDGYEQPANGSLVGYPEAPFTEQTIVHGGGQSMPLFYDNSGTANYSEATLTLTSGRDWTKKGIEALSLWFRGYPASFSTFTEGPPGTYTMTARSGNIAGQSDELHFVYKMLSGAGSIVAKVESVTNTSDSAKAGVMIRDTLDPSSKMALAFARPDGDVRFRRRVEFSGDDSTSNAGILGLPSWVKLDRDTAGNFRAFHSTDGTAWVPVDELSENIQMNAVVYIGLALCSNNTDATCEAIFSSVSTTGTVTGQWQSQDIGILSNNLEPMYAAVANSGGTPAVVYHDDPNAALIGTWTQWNIDLTDFSNQGVVLTNVESISIGFGDKANPQPGGSGTMYFDDIGLYSSRCIPSLRKPQGDINNDCAVNYLDLEIMAGDWLVSGPALESDLDNDEKVDFKDYALLADAWLDELLWP